MLEKVSRKIRKHDDITVERKKARLALLIFPNFCNTSDA